MASAKSPFYVVEDFLTPKQSEIIVDELGFFEPDVDTEGNPIKMIRCHEGSEELIYNMIQPLIPKLEQYYGFKHRATETVSFEFYSESVKPTPICENSSWVKGKWVKTKDRDITVAIFLSDYQENVPFDSEYEVYGGKLEFPQHNFGFNPQRGTLIAYPSGPHFINAVADIDYGDLFLVKFHLAAETPYLYDPSKFPGDYTNWFKDL